MALRSITIEQKIMLRKRRRRIVGWKDGVKRRLSIILPAQEASVSEIQGLAPLLGQVQIMVSDFITLFNESSNIYPEGFPLFVEILVFWDKSYKLNFLPIPFIYILQEFFFLSFQLDPFRRFSEYKQYIFLGDIIRLLPLFKEKYNSTVSDTTPKGLLIQILSILKSLNVFISFHPKSFYINKFISFFSSNKYSNIYFLIRSLIIDNKFLGPVRLKKPPTFILNKKSRKYNKNRYAI